MQSNLIGYYNELGMKLQNLGAQDFQISPRYQRMYFPAIRILANHVQRVHAY
jgi:hypothetical protein